MPWRFSELNFLGWLIGALTLAMAAKKYPETHAQDLDREHSPIRRSD